MELLNFRRIELLSRETFEPDPTARIHGACLGPCDRNGFSRYGGLIPCLIRDEPRTSPVTHLAPHAAGAPGTFSYACATADAPKNRAEAATRPLPFRLSVTSPREALSGRQNDRPAAVTGSLAGLVDLVKMVGTASSRSALETVLATWARGSVGATSTKLVCDGEIESHRRAYPQDEILEDGSDIDGAHNDRRVALCLRVAEPLDEERRRALVVAARVASSALLCIEVARSADLARTHAYHEVVPKTSALRVRTGMPREIERRLERLAASKANLLIEGETGSGKTYVARLIHEAGPRAHAPLRVINCGAIPESLVESELFGHDRGAFTGATSSRVGALEAVGEGTLFLDEIGELPLPSQAKLLRVLDERRFERVGSNRPIELHARVIAATNRVMTEMVAQRVFRSDLLFRLSTLKISVPPLRKRCEDIVPLAHEILEDLTRSAGRRVEGFSDAALEVLESYTWPGNVRELRNVIEHAIVLGEGPIIEPEDLGAIVDEPPVWQTSACSSEPVTISTLGTLAEIEKRAIETALRLVGGNRSRAASILGIGRTTLYAKMASAGLCEKSA